MGCTGTVLTLGQDGAERRRLLAVGFVPGARVTAHRRSPLGDPIAYRVRGGTVALRREQARLIIVVAGDGEGTADAGARAAAGGAT
jgi:ferrous iron transport protein A